MDAPPDRGHVLTERRHEATAAMDLNTVAMDQPKPETAPPSTLEPTRELPSAPAPEAPIREEVSMNNDAPTRIRVSTLDAYGTQGGQTGLTRTTVQRSTLGLVVLASLIGAAAGLAMAYLI